MKVNSLLKRLRSNINIISELLGSSKLKFITISIVSICVVFLEVGAFASLVPFFALVMKTGTINAKVHDFVEVYIGQIDDLTLVYLFCALIVVIFTIRFFINIFYNKFLYKFTYSIEARYKNILFNNYMNLKYKSFVNSDLSHRENAYSFVSKEYVSSTLREILNIISNVSLMLFMYIAILVVQWKITMLMTVFFAISIFVLYTFILKKIKLLGKLSVDECVNQDNLVSMATSNYKLIKFRQAQKSQSLYEAIQNKQRQVSSILGKNLSWSPFPKIFLETSTLLILVAIILYIFYQYGDISAHIPMLSLFLLAFYRVMPALNQSLSSYQQLIFRMPIVEMILKYARASDEIESIEQISKKEIHFNENIQLENISFSYKDDKDILKNISLSINKGEKIAFIGASGAGKTTIADLIIGLLIPKSGTIRVDGVKLAEDNLASWRSHIGYVPQDMTLFYGSVAQNVAMDLNFDEDKVIDALRKAKIYDFFADREGIHTQVGSGGVRLSGGQKQRISIAKALYNDPYIVVLDEATSALDTSTESLVMNEIYEIVKDKTMIVIAHRLSTIESCDVIFRLDNGCLVETLDKRL